MKKTSLLLLAFSLSMGLMTSAEAVTVRIGGPGVVFTNQQPIQVIVVDQNGNTYERTVYYNTDLGGIDLDTSWAGPNASVYIPSLGTGYLWYNGFWVNQDGFYWDNGRRVNVPDVPQWRTHWTGYWQHHHYDNRKWDRGDRHGGDHWWDRGDHWWNRNRDQNQWKDRNDRRKGDFDQRQFQQDGQKNMRDQNLPQREVQRFNGQGGNFRDRDFEGRGDRTRGGGDKQGFDRGR